MREAGASRAVVPSLEPVPFWQNTAEKLRVCIYHWHHVLASPKTCACTHTHTHTHTPTETPCMYIEVFQSKLQACKQLSCMEN